MEIRNQFKQQLSRLFRPSLFLRTSCSSTASSSIFASSATNTNCSRSLSTTTTTTANTNTDILIAHDSFSFSSRMLSLDCSSCKPTKYTEAADVVSVVKNINLKEKKKERRGREIDEGKGRMCPPASPLSPFIKEYTVDYYGFNAIDVAKEEKVKTEKMNVKQKKKKKKKKKKFFLSNAFGFSSSSEFVSCDEAKENEYETARFFTSRSFTSDSSEFYQQPSSRNNNKTKNKKEMKKSLLPRPPRRRGTVRATYDHEGFRPVVSATTKEEDVDISGIPVMKRSSNPYVDFQNSMVEMIIERQIFGGKDLERLLHSYLSLNSSHNHPFILRAFADISEVLFGH